MARLLPLAVLLAITAWAFSELFTWYYSPFVAAGTTGRFPLQIFGCEGVAFAGWTLLSFSLAAFLGALIRRTVVAMAATLGVMTVLDLVTMLSLRQHYASAATVSGANGPANPGDWVLGSWFTNAAGQRVSMDSVFSQLAQGNGTAGSQRKVIGSQATLNQFLAAHHYLQWWSYQPAGRFWSFQSVEGAWVLGLSLILLAGTVLLVRRRA